MKTGEENILYFVFRSCFPNYVATCDTVEEAARHVMKAAKAEGWRVKKSKTGSGIKHQWQLYDKEGCHRGTYYLANNQWLLNERYW